MEDNKRKCYNCKYAGTAFKLGGLTHQHCEHPKYKEQFDKGTLSPYDTLNKFSDTCENHEFKNQNK